MTKSAAICGKLLCIGLLICFHTSLNSQSSEDALMIRKIHDQTLANGSSYDWLNYLSEEIGGRLAGSESSSRAIEYTSELLLNLSDTVYLQECFVPFWERGAKEKVSISGDHIASIELNALALGNSIGTDGEPVTAEIVEVRSLDEVRTLGRNQLEGKIVFFNRPMDPSLVNTFQAYGRAADQRVAGPAVAAEFGAVAVLVRSLTTSQDDIPHTGVTQYSENAAKIPALAISTQDANLLHESLVNGSVNGSIVSNSKMVEERKISYNVIGEIRGSEFPDEIILVGGHLDSWDVGGGAHDDGAGCVHSIQVFETLRQIGYKPKRTLRCVMFMNEENGLGGGKAYAENAAKNHERHIAAIESDSGGFTPRGFTADAAETSFTDYFARIMQWSALLEPYYLLISKGGSGADINPLKEQGGLLIGFRTDSQRYFDFHHTSQDRISVVNERELKLGGAAMTSLVYLLDKYGLE